MNPETQQRRRYENPLFPKQQPREPRRYGGLFAGLVIILLFAGLVALLRAPVFDITLSTIEGSHFIPRTSIESGLESYMQQKVFGVFPRRNYFVFSNEGAAEYLKSLLTEDQAVESLEVQKKFFTLAAVSLVERVPNLVYINGGRSLLLDRKGVVASESTEKPSASFPVLYDQTTRQVAIGDSVLTQETVQTVFSIRDKIKERTDIPIDFFYIPPATCITLTETEEIPNPDFRRNSNTNNTNTAINANTNSVNSNRGAVNNSNEANEPATVDEFIEIERVIYDCEKESIPPVLEIRIRVTEDWEIYFRATDSIDDQITRLIRVIREKKLERRQLDYIDLRFGEQVIYK